MPSKDPGDPLLDCLQGLSTCTPSMEHKALERLSIDAKVAVARSDIQLALGIVNQANQLLSRSATEIRKQLEAKTRTSPSLIENAECLVRVTTAAFKFLHKHRSTAGFNALALEKTLSNFATACTNAHLGMRTWDLLVVLRDWLLEHAEKHCMPKKAQTGLAKPEVARAVRKPQPRTKPAQPSAMPRPRIAGKTDTSTERLAAGLHRLSIGKPGASAFGAAQKLFADPVSFPHTFCQGDTTFNNLVVLMLCNSLRVLSQDAGLGRVKELLKELGPYSDSALDWCLRVRDMDSEAAEPFLGACFRAYYALGGVADEPKHGLQIRLLGLLAYSRTKACDPRELLKYSSRAASKAIEIIAKTGGSGAGVDAFYTGLLAKTTGLVDSMGLSPELVDFCQNMVLARRRFTDIQSAIASCHRLISPSSPGAAVGRGVAGSMVAKLLEVDALVHDMIERGTVYPETATAGPSVSALVESALDPSARYTLASWNALAMCADMIRKTAKHLLASLRQSMDDSIADCVSQSMLFMLEAANRIYEAYVSRGAAAKAEGAGGTSVSALVGCNAEVCAMAAQIAVQHQEDNDEAQQCAMRLGKRLMALCRDSKRSRDYLRTHSTLFFNRGASLYQLKIYRRAAEAMEAAIGSLSLWISLGFSDTGSVDVDALGQLCKRYEIAASAYQSSRSYDRASGIYAEAVEWFILQLVGVVERAVVVGSVVLPPWSSTWDASAPVARVLMFVDRFTRMCANRLHRDPDEPAVQESLLEYAGISTLHVMLRAWILEAEAYYWRQSAAPLLSTPSNSILDTRVMRLSSAQDFYTQAQCSLGCARVGLELAKVHRDQGNTEECLRLLGAAIDVARKLPADCIYALCVIAECQMWQAIVINETMKHDPGAVVECTSSWALVFDQASKNSGLGMSMDTGVLREALDSIALLSGFLLSRRMRSACQGVQTIMLGIALLCEDHDQSWAPATVMGCLAALGTSCLLQGLVADAAEYFSQGAARYVSGALPVHVEIEFKIAYSFFQLATGDVDAGALTMSQAYDLAHDGLVLDSGDLSTLRSRKRNAGTPETLVLLAKASQAYSLLALKQGELADSIDYAVHGYRILYSLVKSLSMAHKRKLQEQQSNRSTAVLSDDLLAPSLPDLAPASVLASDSASASDLFTLDTLPERADNPAVAESKEDQNDAEFIAFSGNWELQGLLVDSLVNLAELYSLRGSIKEAEYFLKKGLSISGQLLAPSQADYVRLCEADTLSRKGHWDECAKALQAVGGDSWMAVGRLEKVKALVVEGDVWRRSREYENAGSKYRLALDGLRDILGGSNLISVEPQAILERVAVMLSGARIQEPANVSDQGPLILSALIAREDIHTRRHLLALLGSHDEDTDDGYMLSSGFVEGRTMEQRTEYLLMRAKLAYGELQQLVSREESWGRALECTLVFPVLRRGRQQKPRRGAIKASVRDKINEVEQLARDAAACAITVGSPGSVHEAAHILAFVMGLNQVFGFALVHEESSRCLARVIDDSRNITAAREAVEAVRRRERMMPASLNTWPTVACASGQRSGGSDSGPRLEEMCSSSAMHTSPSGSPSMMAASRRDVFGVQPQMLGMEHSLLDSDSDSGGGLYNTSGDSAHDSFVQNAVDGARVVATWSETDSDATATLSDKLPEKWTVCGISIDTTRNVLFVTRYQRNQEPLVLCLPMRALDGCPDDSPDLGVFGAVHRRLGNIISESDRTMKTGVDCVTEDDRRRWWEHRAMLDRRLGELLQAIECEWLGGFYSALQPVSPRKHVEDGQDVVETVRGIIQASISSCLSKQFATKARTIEPSDAICTMVLNAAQASLHDAGNHDAKWLHVCAALWDSYCFQGVAVPADSHGDFAEQLLENMRSVSANTKNVDQAPVGQRPHLILALDRHAQQIPWECLPCLRDHPVCRVPSIAFLRDSLVAAKKAVRRSPRIPLQLPRLGNGNNDSSDDNDDDNNLNLLASFRKGNMSSAIGEPLLSDMDLKKPTSNFNRDVRLPGAWVNGQSVYYVLNPEGDLSRTQTNFASWLEQGNGWQGVIGRRPMGPECVRGLSGSDIFMYFGHGGAEGYISRTQVRELSRCAVVLLFGCSSGRLAHAGEYDAMGPAVDYLVAGCPSLVGNLWDVGDKDIDRFAARLLRCWGLTRCSLGAISVSSESSVNARPKSTDAVVNESPVSLAEAVCEARRACRMTYLTGAAP
ncbi:separin protein, partial [Coemansia sp. Benny D115]